MEEKLGKAVRIKLYPFLFEDVSISFYVKDKLILKFEECKCIKSENT